MPVRIQWIIFDLGDVIVKLNRGYRPPAMLSAPPAARALLEDYFRDDFVPGKTEYSLNEKFQLGQVSRAEFLKLIMEAMNGTVSEEQIVREFAGILAGVDEAVVAIMEALKEQCRLACFTNTHAIHWEYILREYSWMRLFEVQASSHLLGFAKPDPAAYATLAARLAAPPSACLFIDDREVNVAGAREAGLWGIRFTGANALREDLRRLGFAV